MDSIRFLRCDPSERVHRGTRLLYFLLDDRMSVDTIDTVIFYCIHVLASFPRWHIMDLVRLVVFVYILFVSLAHRIVISNPRNNCVDARLPHNIEETKNKWTPDATAHPD